jgi:hypothetical protein
MQRLRLLSTASSRVKVNNFVILFPLIPLRVLLRAVCRFELLAGYGR